MILTWFFHWFWHVYWPVPLINGISSIAISLSSYIYCYICSYIYCYIYSHIYSYIWLIPQGAALCRWTSDHRQVNVLGTAVLLQAVMVKLWWSYGNPWWRWGSLTLWFHMASYSYGWKFQWLWDIDGCSYSYSKKVIELISGSIS